MARLQDMTLDELWHLFPIRLVPPDDRWNGWYEEEKHLLEGYLRPFSPVKIHHIGSTAIPGIWAKSIVDILVEVLPDRFESAATVLKNYYLCSNESSSRASFHKGYTEKGFSEWVFHIHLRMMGDHDEVFFRDYLRSHPEAAKEYEILKLDLWKKWEFDRDGYTRSKTDFVNRITSMAKAESRQKEESVENDRALRDNPFIEVKIRPVRPEEVERAIALAWEVFLQFEAPDYPLEGVETFRRDVVENRGFLENCRSGVCPMYGAFQGSRIVGMIGMRSSRTHINLLFVKKDYHHLGIGRRLFEYLLQDQRGNNPSLREVTLNSSPYAVGFYLRLGFEPVAEERVAGGIRYTPMRFLIR